MAAGTVLAVAVVEVIVIVGHTNSFAALHSSDSDSSGIGGVRYVLPRDKVLFLPQDSYCFEVRGCETNDVHYSY